MDWKNKLQFGDNLAGGRSRAMGGDVTDPQSLSRYAYAKNNPATLTDPLGLSGEDPADPCSDPYYAENSAECEEPSINFACALYGICSIGVPGGGFIYNVDGNGGGATATPSAPAPPSTPPAGQPPLGGMGNMGGVYCGPFGCVSPPFQNFYQVGGGVTLWEIIKAACGEDPLFCADIARDTLELVKHYGPGVLRAVWTAGSTEAQTIQCKYAPVLCSTENGLGQRNNLPWWVTPASAKTVPIPSPTKPVPIFNQPTVIPGPGVSPSPGNVVPVH